MLKHLPAMKQGRDPGEQDWGIPQGWQVRLSAVTIVFSF